MMDTLKKENQSSTTAAGDNVIQFPANKIISNRKNQADIQALIAITGLPVIDIISLLERK